MIIAIQPDDYGERNASSPRWAELLQAAGHEVRWVNVYRADILDQLRGCHGFMWRWAHFGGMHRVARRLLPVIERGLGLVTYPDQNTCWHFDDKIAQAYLFEAAAIPAPKTWVWFDAKLARDWVRTAQYPLVIKLAGGAGSSNVRLVQSGKEAELWIDRLFGDGVFALADTTNRPPWRVRARRLKAAAKLALQGILPPDAWELHKDYILFQEFLPDNPFDTRVTVIGNRAFGFRRFNRDNDFRASGSGRIDHNPDEIAPGFVHLAFKISQRLKTQSCAVDGLRRGTEPVVGEISYTYASWAVHDCPGHWELVGNELKWCPGHMWPEEAQVQDFLQALRAKSGH